MQGVNLIMNDKKTDLLQTVERALEVLYLFHEYNGSTLSFVAERLNMSTTVAYRLLHTLAVCGYLKQETDSKKYYLGEKVLLLGYKAIESQELKEIATPIMLDLKEQTGFGVLLTVCADNCSLCVEKLEESENLQLAMRAGSLYPLQKGASNRPLLAFMEQEKKEAYIDSLALSNEQKKALRVQLEEIKIKGYDYSSGLLTQGLFAIGFPVYGLGGHLIAALSIGGYSSQLEEREIDRYIEKTKLAAQSLSRLLGAAS